MDQSKNLSVPGFTYLTDKQQKKMHNASLEILEKIGAYILDKESMAIFKKGGARVEEEGRVYIPPKLVEWAISVSPRKTVLHDRNGNPSMDLQAGKSYFGPGSDCLFMLDHETGERREGTIKDVRDISRVSDALPNIDFLMSGCVPSDVSSENANHRQMYEMIVNSIKPIMFVTNDYESSVDVVKAAELIAGGEEVHSKKPYSCCYINVTDPLKHNSESLQKLLLLSRKNFPTTYTPMVLRGANGPVTSAGAVALANAGELVGLVLAQLNNEGAPIIHGGGYDDVFDMRFMCDVYTGPESYGSRVDMARYYGLPIFGLGGASDSKLADGQAVAEAGFTLFMEALGGASLVHDVGYIESGKCYSLEMLVICNELIGYIRHFIKGIEVNDETLALDLIMEQGPGGDYLGTEHTVTHYKEDWHPELFDRNFIDAWKSQGSTTLNDRAKARLKDILEHYEPKALETELHKKLDTIL